MDPAIRNAAPGSSIWVDCMDPSYTAAELKIQEELTKCRGLCEVNRRNNSAAMWMRLRSTLELIENGQLYVNGMIEHLKRLGVHTELEHNQVKLIQLQECVSDAWRNFAEKNVHEYGLSSV